MNDAREYAVYLHCDNGIREVGKVDARSGFEALSLAKKSWFAPIVGPKAQPVKQAFPAARSLQ